MTRRIPDGISDLFFNYQPAVEAFDNAPVANDGERKALLEQANDFLNCFDCHKPLDYTAEELADDFLGRL